LAAATYGRGAFEILVGPSTIAGQCVSLANATLAGLGGVTMFLDASGDGTLDLNDLQTPTDGKGNYLFAKVPPGVYTVRAISPPGYISISPAPTVTVNGSALTNVNVNLSLPQHVPPPQFRLGTISGR
jgi:hypothetical protein